MINFIKEQLASYRLKKTLKDFASPDKAFLKSVRTRFVFMAQEQAGVAVHAKHSHSWKYATIAVVAVLSMTSGIAVFADANNVSATHPLYNFKRISEQVRLGLSSPDQQVELHRVFAHRRLEEAAEIEANHDDNPISKQSKTQIDTLDKDFEKETEIGISKAGDPKVHPAARARFCHDIQEVVQQRAKTSPLPPIVMDHIKVRCGDASRNQ